jgi:glycosyltransferase involved in cell wall biosynthesis
MRRAIEDVVYSDARVNQLQALGKEKLNEFSWDKCSQETLNIYKSLFHAKQ